MVFSMVATVNWAKVSCCNCSSRTSSTPMSGSAKWVTSAGDWGVCLGAWTAAPPLCELPLHESQTKRERSAVTVNSWSLHGPLEYKEWRMSCIGMDHKKKNWICHHGNQKVIFFKHCRPPARGLLVLFIFKKKKILHSLSHVVLSSCAGCWCHWQFCCYQSHKKILLCTSFWKV